MSNWKKVAYLIIGVIIFVVIKLWFNQIDEMAAAERYPYELARKERECFEKLTEYCKENEDMYMEISEQVFDYMSEGLSIDEACIAMENNATLEQKEILEQTVLRYPNYKGNVDDGMFEDLTGNGLYYFMKGGVVEVKAIYIHEYSEEIEEYITSMRYAKIVKINDHLYVCYTSIPYRI